ncbi:hypothetical protein CKM354_000099800 [Cercospora kikuchii]|uniref:F-box domain-containing protein n=1 Tax=Cercospora kikuchii TaxID=84275 RepID=A0A9P3C4Z0_9PEZI|nr:uncharacterized protein CKM354_000099800 [Cercospora kikuchii]GIZ37554.1 hypothetical protein CKM354_000099800 [Cercospora kikuchii]
MAQVRLADDKMAQPTAANMLDKGDKKIAHPQPDGISMKARSKVFALPELVEKILEFVDTMDLFRLQRVNTSFKDTITRSKALRKHMFLEPWDTIEDEEQNKALIDFLKAGFLDKVTQPFQYRANCKGTFEDFEHVHSRKNLHIFAECSTNVYEDDEVDDSIKVRGGKVELEFPSRYDHYDGGMVSRIVWFKASEDTKLGELAGECFAVMKENKDRRSQISTDGAISRLLAEKHPEWVLHKGD